METIIKTNLTSKLEKALLNNKFCFVMKENENIIFVSDFETKNSLSNYLKTFFDISATFEYRTAEEAYVYRCNYLYKTYLELILKHFKDGKDWGEDENKLYKKLDDTFKRKEYFQKIMTYDNMVLCIPKGINDVDGIFERENTNLICSVNSIESTKGNYENISFEIY